MSKNLLWTDSNESIVRYEPWIPAEERSQEQLVHVSWELKGICNFFREKIDETEYPCPYVFLSDKIKYRTYGKLSDRSVVDALQEYAVQMKPVPMHDYFASIIDCICHNLALIITAVESENEFEPDWSDFYVTLGGAEWVVAVEGTEEDRQVLSDILGIINQMETRHLILEEYVPDRHQIILYPNAMEREIRREGQRINLRTKLSIALAHSYFHAMHYSACPRHFIWNPVMSHGMEAMQKAELTESLADYFSVLWCYDQAEKDCRYFSEAAEERITAWKRELYSANPQAKAIYFLRDEEDQKLPGKVDRNGFKNGFHRFMDVYRESTHDTYATYRMLRGR